jgi:hypothetical protein
MKLFAHVGVNLFVFDGSAEYRAFARNVFLRWKEKIMNMADMLIYVHPELDDQRRSELERTIEGRIGVDCAEFEHHDHPHALIVKYEPDAVQGMQILDMVRKTDPKATMVGL